MVHLFLLNILLCPLTVHMGVSTTDTSLRLLTRLEKPVDERKRVVCFFANNEHNYNLVFVSQLARDQVFNRDRFTFISELHLSAAALFPVYWASHRAVYFGS